MTTYLDQIRAKYDIRDYKESAVTIPKLPQDGIVLIVGTSGSGKSTILNTLGNQQAQFDPKTTVIENFSTPERGEELLLACDSEPYPLGFVRLPH